VIFVHLTCGLFDFLDDAAGCTQRIMDAIDSHQVSAVILLATPGCSPLISPDIKQQLRGYPIRGLVEYPVRKTLSCRSRIEA